MSSTVSATTVNNILEITTGNGQTQYCIYVDLTPYSKIEFTIRGGYSGTPAAGKFGVFKSFGDNNTLVGDTMLEATFKTVSLDISQIQGNQYVGAVVYSGTRHTYISSIILR